jgi:hypothetical protein
VRRVQRMALGFGLATAILVAVLLVHFVACAWRIVISPATGHVTHVT